jgi:hypothetical protein
MTTLGPGTLKIGPTATSIDVSCLINNARVEADKDQSDPRTHLCGTSVPGRITYAYKLTGSIDTDSETDAGIFAYSHAHAGEVVDFEFVPNTASGTSAAGTLIIDPLDFGADEYGAPLDSDFEFSIIDQPTFTYPAALAAAGAAAEGKGK